MLACWAAMKKFNDFSIAVPLALATEWHVSFYESEQTTLSSLHLALTVIEASIVEAMQKCKKAGRSARPVCSVEAAAWVQQKELPYGIGRQFEELESFRLCVPAILP